MTRNGMLMVISGPSGVGKGTLCTALRQEVPDLVYSISATSRAPRPGEVHGVNYYFWSRSEFEERLAQEEFLEWAQVYGNLYGTPKTPVLEALRQGKDVILEIDFEGARQIREQYPEGVFVFITPPSLEELSRRLLKRGTDSAEIRQFRLDQARDELAKISGYDYLVPNDDLKTAVNLLKAILLAERCRISRLKRYL